jgi:hypothetical protein
MEPAERIVTLILLLFAALVAPAGAGQKPTSADSPIHLISCSIEKVNQCLAQESASGYVAIHIAATVIDRPRSTGSPGFGLVSSEDPVLVTRKSNVPKRQTVAIIDDLAKRETQLNQAGAAGMRLLPNQIAVLRSWTGGVSEGGFGVVRSSPGGVSVDGYAALFEEVTPSARFGYRVVDVADKAVSEKLKRLVSEGYRSVAIVAPAILVMERRAEDVSTIDEYRILKGVDAQHVGSELTKATVDGFRVVTTGASTTGLLTLVLLEHVADDKGKIEYQVFSSHGARELERQLNETAQRGYSPVSGGILPIITRERNDRGMTTPPQRVELIVGRTGPKHTAFKVLNAFGRDLQPTLDAALGDGYEFVEFVGVMNENFVILGHQAQSSAAGKN